MGGNQRWEHCYYLSNKINTFYIYINILCRIRFNARIYIWKCKQNLLVMFIHTKQIRNSYLDSEAHLTGNSGLRSPFLVGSLVKLYRCFPVGIASKAALYLLYSMGSHQGCQGWSECELWARGVPKCCNRFEI